MKNAPDHVAIESALAATASANDTAQMILEGIGGYPKETITCALTRIANAMERQTEVHERIGNEISSAIIAIANRIEDSYTGQDGIIGAICDVRDALRGRKK